MGSCCFKSNSVVENTPLVADNVSQNNSMLEWSNKAKREMLEERDVEQPVVDRGVAGGVGKKRTLLQEEGPPEKAPTLSEELFEEDSDQCDGVPLHLPVDAACTAATNSRMESLFRNLNAITRTTCIGGISQKPQKCPYCDHEGGNIFFYLTMPSCSHRLLEKLYQAGWWRTGTICFKPDIRNVCCPNYSIRLEVNRFVVSKSQRAIVRRFKNFLCKGDTRWKGVVPSQPDPQDNLKYKMESSTKKQKQKGPVKPGKGADPSKPPCRKAKEIRKEKWEEKQKLHGENTSIPKQPQKPKCIEEILADADRGVPGQKHRFRQEILPCNPLSPKLTSLLPREYELYCKFQESVHFGKTKFHSFDEFKWGFVESMVMNEDRTGVTIGTCHIHYYLDDELVMVTVADITSTLFISIYFFYDPDIRFIHPGIYTIIREIALTRQLQKAMPNLKYYILGYYNYTIPKVSYKHQFRPTEIQCPDTYRWLPLEKVLPRISVNRYARLSDDEYNPEINKTVDNLFVSLYSIPMIQYGSLPPNAQSQREMLTRLVQEFGPYNIPDDIMLDLTPKLDI